MRKYPPLIEKEAMLHDFLEEKLLEGAILHRYIDMYPQKLPCFCSNEKRDGRFGGPSIREIMEISDVHIYVVNALQLGHIYCHREGNALNNL